MTESKTTILIPTEFHADSGRVQCVALSLCRRLNARAVFLHVLTETTRDPAWHTTLTPLMPVEVHYEFMARKKMKEIEQFFRDNGVSCESIVQKGDAAEVIVKEMHESRPDFVVIGSKRHRGVTSGILGGTVERVLANAHCPVLVVPHLLEQAAAKPSGIAHITAAE